jgi:hypothetical protein
VLFCILPAGAVEADAPHAPHTPLTKDNAPATPNAATPLLRPFVLEVRVSPAIIFSFWCLHSDNELRVALVPKGKSISGVPDRPLVLRRRPPAMRFLSRCRPSESVKSWRYRFRRSRTRLRFSLRLFLIRRRAGCGCGSEKGSGPYHRGVHPTNPVKRDRHPAAHRPAGIRGREWPRVAYLVSLNLSVLQPVSPSCRSCCCDRPQIKAPLIRRGFNGGRGEGLGGLARRH